ncbi:hypothetical protein HNQ93_004305 [Hymenobacter luteus]|uniref:Uncharacterized protein n=3 Tax=Hymenobacteraceae TaxID=1853232 RepID=A0A7W9T4H2_9BACT|nr:hypothetical protein [Hymenobacter latericoloratus]MBB6061426.1 hypothetical protein [Hymenobacter luteus]
MSTASINPLTLLPKGRPFNVSQSLKRKMASSFAADANDFLWRVGILNSSRPHDTNSFFSKMYVDLLMSAECSLKSLIVSLSPPNETPEDAYLKIRSLGHNLEKLYKEVERRAVNRLKLLKPAQRALLMDANTIGVGYRYDITIFFFLSRESRLDRAFQQGTVSRILNYDFIMALYNMLHELRDLADAAQLKRFGPLTALSMKQLGKIEEREDAFFAAVGHRL